MADWSRDEAPSAAVAGRPSEVNQSSFGVGTSDTSSSTSTRAVNVGSQDKTYVQSNMDRKSMEALQQLIAQLSGGGTEGQAQETAARAREVQNVTALREGYGRDAALADAQGAMAQQLRQVVEKLAPSLTRAAEGAGTSQNSMRALMLQDIAARAAENASAVGLDAVAKYGQLGVGFSQVLEALTRPQDQVTQDLLAALNIAKGAQVSGTERDTTFNVSNQSTQSRQSTVTTQQGDAKTQYSYDTPTYETSTTPSGVTTNFNTPSSAAMYQSPAGNLDSIFSKYSGNNSGWDNYTF